MRVRSWAVSTAALALVVGLVTPALGSDRPAVGHSAKVAANPTCLHDGTDYPSDTCTITALTDHSVSMTWSTTPVNPYCVPPNSAGCIFSFQGGFTLSLQGAGTFGISGSCPAAKTNPTFTQGGDDIGLNDANALVCSATWTWDPTTQFPLQVIVSMDELNGQGTLETPDQDHTFGANLPTPGPNAEFTDVADKDDPGAFTFTDASFSVVPGVTIASEKWTSDDGGQGTGPTWDHTFDKDGTYNVTLDVTDSSDKTAEVTHEVTVSTLGGSGSSASITVKEKLSPKSDAGRFDLRVGTKTVKAKAGNGDHGVAHLKAGHYVVSQVAKTVGLTDYGIALSCTKNGKKDFTAKASGGSVKVSGGDAEVCTFTDTRSTKKHCDVPQLAGKSLKAASKALTKAHCKLGSVTKPKHPAHGKKLVVGHSSPAAYAVKSNGSKVRLVLVS